MKRHNPENPLQRNIPTPPLNYIAPKDDRQEIARRSTQRYFAFVASTLTMFGATVISVLSIPVHFDGSRSPQPSIRNAVILLGSIIAILGIVAWIEHRRGKHHIVQGILIGIGLALLVEGACFALKWL
jgi:hypothetical protein